MTMRDILVPLFQHIDFDPQLAAAGSLALSLDARVNVVFMRPDAVMTAASVPDMLVAAGIVVEAIEKESSSAEAVAMARFETWQSANDQVDAAWRDRCGPVKQTIGEIGRVSDLIVIGRLDPYEPVTDEIFHAALYGTGRPTIMVPDMPAGDPADHVLIAWNGSLQAARAVEAALPILSIAKRVSIFTVAETPNNLERDLGLSVHLSHHGIEARSVAPGSQSTDIGARLIETATQENASMIVMGAYTHHPLREALLGGVTRHVLKHAEIPVFMMH